jgi:hypothetical protein
LSALEIGNGVGRREVEVFCKNTEYLETGLSFKKGTFLIRVSCQRGNISQQVFLPEDNFSQKRTGLPVHDKKYFETVLHVQEGISRTGQGFLLSKRERVFFKMGYLGTRFAPWGICLGTGIQDQEGISCQREKRLSSKGDISVQGFLSIGKFV